MKYQKQEKHLLAIESSCDDTSAAVYSGDTLLSHVIANQEVHRALGGVVPELASRQHQIHILPVVEYALQKADVEAGALSAIAFTKGPGLMGSLLVGTAFAKGLAFALDVPLIGVNHMEAHVLAHFIEAPKPSFPFLCLTVSGGHTQIVRVDDALDMSLLGQTRDDAAGEAFDKTGKMLGLDYPAGPWIDKLAKNGTPRFAFPLPQVDDLDFSFSGLKTAIRYFLRDQIKKDSTFIQSNLEDICASVQYAIVTILMAKLREAVARTGIRQVAIAGGVSANSGLRDAVNTLARELDWQVYIPKIEYCTDNAAMIGMAGYFKYREGLFEPMDTIPDVRWKLGAGVP